MTAGGPARALAFVALSAGLSGCLFGAEVMIISSVAEAAIKTGMRYAEENKPSPEEVWDSSRLAHLQQRAANGDVDAQLALGMHYQAESSPAARYWICRAAMQGQPLAQLQYGHWYNGDRRQEDLWPFIGVTPDDRRAYVWYRLAGENGEPSAALFIDRLGGPGGLTGTARDEAETMHARWTPRGCGFQVPAAADPAGVGAEDSR